jgi:hypothetical protein
MRHEPMNPRLARDESEKRPHVPEDRRSCALQRNGFEEEADTKCLTQLVP